MRVPVSRQWLLFEFRYEQGLDDIVNRGQPTLLSSNTTASVKYRGIYLQVAYLFDLGGE